MLYPPRVDAALKPFSLERMERGVEKVTERLLRASSVLEAAGVPYAVAGGNAVALWVSRVDEAAVRNTREVDVLLRREDFEAAKVAMEAAGFVHRRVKSVDAFLDGPDAKIRDAVHVVFANEIVRAGEAMPSPDVSESESTGAFRVLSLPALVRVKLTAFRLKDRVHLLDLIEMGLLGESDRDGLPPVLAERLQGLLDDPDG